MNRPFVPQAVVDLAHARRDARLRREWAEADGYRAEIEAAGWVVVDRGVDFDLRPARPADVVEDGEVRYGSSGSVPSLLDEPDTGPVTVVVVVRDANGAEDVSSAADGEVGVPVIVVVDGPVAGASGRLATGESPGEVIRLATAGTVGAARNAGIRRATGAVIVLVESSGAIPAGLVRALVEAVSDPTVAIAGSVGLVSAGLPRFDRSPDRDVDAVTGTIAFRRADYRARGPFDERFQVAGELDAWWSLVLRDNDEEPPGRAVRVGQAAPAGAGTSGDGAISDAPGRRRDRYRILDRFGGRVDLISGAHPG